MRAESWELMSTKAAVQVKPLPKISSLESKLSCWQHFQQRCCAAYARTAVASEPESMSDSMPISCQPSGAALPAADLIGDGNS